MQSKLTFLALSALLFWTCNNENPIPTPEPQKSRAQFNIEKDLLIGNFDCKTDVDDLHSVAAFTTLLASDTFSKVKYHAVAGAYGMQEGLYVPPNELFNLAFGNNWTDAHANRARAINQVKTIATLTMKQGGRIWIAEAGQSDFSAALAQAIATASPDIDLKEKFHIVQHSDWNEKVTTPESLQFVKDSVIYHRIADGNAEGNGTPGFNNGDFKDWQSNITDPKLQQIWQLAIELGNQYNGTEERYLNESIKAGGLDFSDVSESCWILGVEEIKDVEAFFEFCGK